MNRKEPVAALGHRADIDYLDLVRVRRGKHSLCNIFCCFSIDCQCLLWEIICCRRDHSAHMENIIRPGNSSSHILVTCQVPPYYLHCRVIGIFIEFSDVLFARSCKYSDLESVAFLIKFLEACPTHVSGRSCQEYNFHIYVSLSFNLYSFV